MMQNKENEKQIVVFKTDDMTISINACFDKETAWLSLDQMQNYLKETNQQYPVMLKTFLMKENFRKIQLLQNLQQLLRMEKHIR